MSSAEARGGLGQRGEGIELPDMHMLRHVPVSATSCQRLHQLQWLAMHSLTVRPFKCGSLTGVLAIYRGLPGRPRGVWWLECTDNTLLQTRLPGVSLRDLVALSSSCA